MSVPFVVFTVYAALTQVPERDDGGRRDRRRRRVAAVPVRRSCRSIRPVLLVVGLLQVIWDLRVFTQIYVLQEAGGITRETNLLGTYIYRLGVAEGEFGIGRGVAIFMLALTVVLTAPYVRRMLDGGGS